MYAAFAIGQRWDTSVLLDTDESGHQAQAKINAMNLKAYAADTGHAFRVLMLGDAAGATDVAIEDIFPDAWYLDCVNRTYGLALKPEDLPEDGSTLITKRVETAQKQRQGRQLTKRDVLTAMLRDFDGWKTIEEVPADAAANGERLFTNINAAFGIVD